MAEPLRFIGIDVSKAFLDVASRPDGQQYRLPNTEAGIAILLERLTPLPPTLILLEATGGYERAAAVALTNAKLAVRIIDPNRVRQFARTIGQHSKTDRLDARVLAHFAEAIRPEARVLPDQETFRLQALLERRRQLVTMRVAEQNRLKQHPSPTIQAGLKAHIAYLAEQVEQVDGELCEVVQAKEKWKLRDEVLRSIPGVGPCTSHILLGRLPELGSLSGKQVASLSGLAPRARDSGTVRGARTIFGGRGDVRTALYIASISAIRCNPALRAFYQRLRAKNKKAKVALTAVSRKLLTMANAMIRDMKPWSPDLATGLDEN